MTAFRRLSLACGTASALIACAACVTPAHAQLPVTQLAYSAKFLCGYNAPGFPGPVDPGLPTGCSEYTVIEVHNPHTVFLNVTVKVVQDSPSGSGTVILSGPFTVNLAPNQSWEWNCSNYGFPFGTITRGFVEILSPRQVKVVALYKEFCGWGGYVKSASIAKKSSPFFFFTGVGRHSGTFLAGDHVSSGGDTIRHETLISLANMSNNPVNCNISFVDATGTVHTFPKLLNPNGFYGVTEADLPLAVPRPFTGGVTVQYASTGVALLECEEIIQKHTISGLGNMVMSMDVVEVQPIPRR